MRKGNVAVIRILVTIILMAVIFGYPVFAEGTDGPCAAFVALATKQAVPSPETDNAAAKGVAGAVGGTAGYKVVAERYPVVPPQLSCTWMFWRAKIDPASMADMA